MRRTKSIFETYGVTPIKDVQTPRRPIDCATGEEEEEENVQQIIIGRPVPSKKTQDAPYIDAEFADDMYSLMVSIRLLLVALVIMKLIVIIRR